jgi:hypothetical protein
MRVATVFHHACYLQESRRTAMWNQALMRLLSLSFMLLFVTGLLWDQDGQQGEASGQKPKSKEISRAPTIDPARGDGSSLGH